MITDTRTPAREFNNLLSVSNMEVKMFVSGNPDEVQQQINDWLSDNEVEVKHIGQSQSEKNGRFLFIVSLFFQRP